MNRLLSILVSLFVLFLIYLWINHIMTSPPHSEVEDQTSSRVIDETEKEQILDDYQIEESGSDDDQRPVGNEDHEQESAQDTEGAPDDESVTGSSGEAVPEGGEDTTDDQEQPGEPEPADPEPADPEPADPEPETAEPDPPPPATRSSTEPSAAPDGIHMVIAGNFLERKNAEQRMQHLKENGFPNAEVVNFQLSQFHTVSAGRYNDIGDARKVKQRLRDQLNIDAYVRHGN